jgi:hypothetical protein
MKFNELFKNLFSPKIPKTARYLIGLAAVPLLWYIGVNILSGSNTYTFTMIFIVACMFAGIALILKKIPAPAERLKEFVWDSEKQPGMKYYSTTLILMLILPVGGLALNAEMADFNGVTSGGLFGDFSHPLYYVIAALNSLLLMLPPQRDSRLRLFLFFLKTVGYTYILYFFAVFLPILPLGVLGLMFAGLGILVFAPSAAAVWQGIHMFREWKTLSRAWSHQGLAVLFLLGLLTLPLCLTSVYWGDKANFQAAVQYLDQANQKEIETVNPVRLNRTLKNMKGSFQPVRGFMSFSEGSAPILSEVYSRLVLDGKMISQEKVMELENLFFDAGHDLSGNHLSDDSFAGSGVRLTAADTETQYDENIGAYRTWVNLSLQNGPDTGSGEYVTSFKLPDGAYVSDYYLDVAGTRKEGILADRRAAEFLYQKIVRASKDPGLLRYTGRNTLELRVFPFRSREQRKTGFEVIHNEPFDLSLDHKIISLGEGADKKPQQESPLVFGGGILLPSGAKKGLEPAGVREPKYYFVLDNSKNSDIQWLVSQVEAYTKNNNIAEAEVLFVNYKTWFHTLDDMHEANYGGNYGYNLNLAMRMIFGRVNASENYPVIIAVSDNLPSAVLPRDMYPLSEQFPESEYYYALNHNLTLTPYSYDDNKAEATVKEPVVQRVLSCDGHLVADNGKSQLIFDSKTPGQFSPTGNQYRDALLLDAMQRKLLTDGSLDTLDLVRGSFRSRILTPQTAFIVVETAAQEKELLNIQEHILNNSFDPTLVTLDEPPLWIGMLLLIIMLLLNRRKLLRTRAQ